ncbi:hypothetical protein AL053_12540 [Pseudomonas savastanoi pv. fraxini]|uniref:DUF2254 domain-containing protein n=1 Tax=Pseudomonas savastanoi TaxID=29438 RepID=UPI00073A5108|nr:DUF2254 domain-containing protein [Pseudomonas savastanoi]KUG43543.1 hypothetical protein ALP79_200050 [Pseudomonas savastanoi pv. fraxini]KWS81899.1 hypothetical protein AL053_12540 [Pseudomonas savastanoi pv. fraxini]PAB32095.1 hypothetical protein CCZ00_13745 [Pseudomonas savastanoi pv. fraxini]RMR74271.1 hypothetical protein ALP82_02115 [Pseudomonas savastanoi pv. fraxini]RMR76468.1 hypothetical protein ALP81_01764 [Pseudomonas savastanoi pv. fraxini]
MVARWQWLLIRTTKRLWFRAGLFSLLGIVTALLAVVLRDHIPIDLPGKIGADAVDKILGIIASSMLAVTTFSLSTMVTAYGAASTGTTPRATTLVMEDTTTQNALSTFIGSFLFSLVGIIALSTGAYGAQGRVILFAVTLIVVVLIVYTLLRWIDHLSRLGRVGETIDRVEAATISALTDRCLRPYLGGCAYPEHPAQGLPMLTIQSRDVGYVQHIDVPALEEFAQKHAALIYLEVVPGSFVNEGEPLVRIVRKSTESWDEAKVVKILSAITFGVRRTFEHDPRFGLSVLAEIASRALSPAVNDPGTAIDVIGRGIRAFNVQARSGKLEKPEIRCSCVHVRGLSVEDMFDDFFSPIARDGAALIEVNIRLVKALASLPHASPSLYGDVCARHIGIILERAEAAMTLDADKARLKACIAASPP